jgi:uncharacterized repeat protein (TIGR01451 family)
VSITVNSTVSGSDVSSYTYAWASVSGSVTGSGDMMNANGSLAVDNATPVTHTGSFTNDTGSPIDVSFTYTFRYSKGATLCEGTPFTTTVTVLPAVTTTVTIDPTPPIIYSGDSATLTLTSGLTGGSMGYTWMRSPGTETGETIPASGNISAVAAGSFADISGILVNDESSNREVVFTFTPTYIYNNNSGSSPPCMGATTSAVITVRPSAANNDLSITVATSAGEGYKGDRMEYVITVKNHGRDTVSSATVDAKLPSEFLYRSHAPVAVAYDTVSGKWIVGRLAPQDSAVLTIKMVLNVATKKLIQLSAHVDIDLLNSGASIPETNYDNNVDTVYVEGLGYSAEIDKWPSIREATPGDEITFTIRVTTLARHNVDTLWIRDVLPSGVEFVSIPPPGNYIHDAHEVQMRLLPPQDTVRDIMVVARVLKDALNATITNYAEVYRDNAPDVIMDTAVTSLRTTSRDLYVSASVTDAESTGDPHVIKREYTVRIEYNNLGMAPTKTATLTARFNKDRQRLRFVTDNGVVDNDSSIVTWQLTDILKTDGNKYVEMRVNPLYPGIVRNEFHLDTEELESSKNNNEAVINVNQLIWPIQNILTDYSGNNVLHIPQLEDPVYGVTQARLTVYNVRGDMVYTVSNYKGLSDDQKFTRHNQPPGTYYYELLVEFNNGDSPARILGWILLL